MIAIPPNDVVATLKKILNGREEIFPVHLCANHPQIAERICKYWHEPRMLQKYFSELLITDREKRMGFSSEIYREIFRLSHYYSTLRPKVIRKDNFWHGIDTR